MIEYYWKDVLAKGNVIVPRKLHTPTRSVHVACMYTLTLSNVVTTF